MQVVIVLGAVISLIGLVGIIWSIMQVRRARKEAADDEALRARIQAVLPMNLAAFGLSVLGLMCVVVGVLLG